MINNKTNPGLIAETLNLASKLAFGIGILTILFFFHGCGGGTTGTGDIQSTRLAGKIVLPDGSAASNANVAIAETGDSSTTDPNGEFIITSKIPAGPLSLIVDFGTLSATASLGILEQEGSNISVVIEADQTSNSLKVISQETTPPVNSGAASSQSSASASAPPDTGGSTSSTPSGTSTPAPDNTDSPGAEPTRTPNNGNNGASPTPLPTATPTQPAASEPTSYSVRFGGTVINNKGNALSDVQITVVDARRSSTTSSSGSFSIRAGQVSGNVQLRAQYLGGSDSVTISNVPSDNVFVRLQLKITITTPGNPLIGRPPEIALSVLSVDISEDVSVIPAE